MSESEKEALDAADDEVNQAYAEAMRGCDKQLKKLSDEEALQIATRAAAMGIMGQHRAFFISLPDVYLPAVFCAMQATLFTINKLRCDENTKKAKGNVAPKAEDPPQDEV